MFKNLIEVIVPSDSEFSVITGRNGTYRIKAVSAWESNDHVHVHIEGIGRSGFKIRGGLTLTLEAFDELCQRYLEARKEEKIYGKKTD